MTTVYYADVSPLNNDTIYEAAMQHIGHDRQSKANRLIHRSDRNLSVGAWLLLIHSLKARGIDPRELEFKVHKSGMPYIANRDDVHFSLSHSGDIAVCAMSDRPVGVDTEQTGDFNPDICKRFFHKNEYKSILANPDKLKQQEDFFRLWTLKESYVKMTGSGISGFGDFVIELASEPRIVSGEMNAYFKEWSVGGYKVAVCCRAGIRDTKFERINLIKMFME